MKEDIIDTRKALLDLLQEPWNWKIITTFFQPDLPPINHPRQEEWQQHAIHHAHDYLQIVIILEGEEFYLLEKQIYHSVPGTILLIDAGQIHLDRPVNRSLASTIFRVDILPNRIQTCVWRRKVDGMLDVPDTEDIFLPESVGQAFRTYWQEIRERKPDDDYLLRHKLIHATGSLLTEILNQESLAQFARCLSHEDLFRSITENLREKGGAGMSIDALAASAGYSRSHFSQMFREYTGKSFHEYIDDCRILAINRVKKLGWSHRIVAQMLGFSDVTAYLHWRAKHLTGGKLTSNKRPTIHK
jgi:AraC-like DNA-binding protein